MKNYYLLLMAFALYLFNIPATISQTITGNGNVTKVDRNLDAFSSVSVGHGWDLILNQGNGHKMTIEADENIIEVLKTEVKNGHLRIYFEKGVRVRDTKMRRIYLTFEEVHSMNASGGSDVTAESALSSSEGFSVNLSGGSDLMFTSLKTSSFTANLSGGADADVKFSAGASINIDASGGSDIDLQDVEGDECNINLSGGSDLTMHGEVSEASMIASGGSDLNCSNLRVGSGNFNLSGGSDGDFGEIDQIEINLSGSSDFRCSGNPKIIDKSIGKNSSFKTM